jgi:hypothetical protein
MNSVIKEEDKQKKIKKKEKIIPKKEKEDKDKKVVLGKKEKKSKLESKIQRSILYSEVSFQ